MTSGCQKQMKGAQAFFKMNSNKCRALSTTALYKAQEDDPFKTLHAYQEKVTIWFIIKSCPSDKVPCTLSQGWN